MLDIKYIREHTKEVVEVLAQKRISVDLDALLSLDSEIRSVQDELQALQADRNAKAKKQTGKPTPEEIQAGKELKEKIAALEKSSTEKNEKFLALLYAIPNLISVDTPEGKDDSENVVVRTWGDVPTFDFEIKAKSEYFLLFINNSITQSRLLFYFSLQLAFHLIRHYYYQLFQLWLNHLPLIRITCEQLKSNYYLSLI